MYGTPHARDGAGTSPAAPSGLALIVSSSRNWSLTEPKGFAKELVNSL